MNKLVTVSKANNINSVVKKEIQKPVKVKKERPEKKKKVKPVIKETTEILKINAKDFVVRTHIFRCMHNNHKIENIDAIVAVTNEDGKQQECRISAGYCPRCKITLYILVFISFIISFIHSLPPHVLLVGRTMN